MKTMQQTIALSSAIVACSLIALCPPDAWAQRSTPSASQGGVSWQVTAPNNGVSLRVSQPDGTVFEQTFASGQAPAFTSPSGVLLDGSYTYELRVAPVVSAEARAQGKAADAEGEGQVAPSASVQSGGFRVVGGVVKLPEASTTEPTSSSSRGTPTVPEDVFTTVTVQANNPVLTFDDNSIAVGFPMNDWAIDANEDNDGGLDRLSILDVTGGTAPFTIRAGAPDDSLYVASNARVGLGTAVPAQPLHISKDVNPNIRLDQTNATIPRVWELQANDSNGFRIRDVTAGRTSFSIRSDTGEVGLGTPTPAGQFHVLSAGNQLSIFQSSDNNAVQFRLQTNSINRRFVALNAAGTQQSQLLFGDNGAFDFLGPTAADVRMRFLDNGNVGIGTTAPTAKLSVNGSANKPGGGSWAVFSDERLKDIKGEFTSGLDAVMKLHPIRYEYKADNALALKSEGEHIGFGAAAVSKVIPEAVTKNADGYLMVDNDPILWTMLNAIKEQNAHSVAQDQEIAQLKEQLKRLQAQVVLQAESRRLPQKRAVAKAKRQN